VTLVADSERLRAAVRAPLELDYHPLYRFYAGGSMSRAFRGLPPGEDDWWSEDWVGSCTLAGNDDPEGRPQGLSEVEIAGIGRRTLLSLIEALPEEMVGAAFADRWGPIGGVLVKLLSPSGPVPLHAHPDRAWAREHLGSPFGKTEAWILLDTPGDGDEPAYAGIGFREDVTREAFVEAVRRRDARAVRDSLHRIEIHPGEVYVAHGGVPHYLGPRVSFIEVQEPSDHLVIPEWTDPDDAGATMGLGFDEALGMLDFAATSREATLARARQRPEVRRTSSGGTETGLLGPDARDFFDASRLDVSGELEVSDGRFSIAIVIAGEGAIEGEFGRVPLRRGLAFALPASLDHRYVAGTAPLSVVRSMGPAA
jgi:mannose-6-phosphate isomerase